MAVREGRNDRRATAALMGEIIPLFQWEVHIFPWGTAVKSQRTQRWTNVFVADRELELEGIDVDLDEYGIIFR